MKYDTLLISNERSEGGELISEANLLFNKNDWIMKKAVGELSLKTKNAKDNRNQTLFPDVIIFADENKLKPLMGWELKMPETSINDEEFISNARDKADRLGTSVFVLWNFKYACVYIRNKDKTWNNHPEIIFDSFKEELNSRLGVQSNQSLWKKKLFDVLNYLNQCLLDKKFSTVPIEFNISNYVQTIASKLTPITTEYILKMGNHRLIEYIKYWVKNEKSELECIDKINSTEKQVEAYAKNIIIKWINRLIFAHLLRENNNTLNSLLVEFSKNQDITELKNLLNNAVHSTDFFTIFHVDIYETSLPSEVVENLNEFNIYLSNCDFSEVGTNFTSKILENIIEISKRELMGLYTTPTGLAKYLVGVTLEEVKGNFADFTVGSGTIAKYLMDKISEFKGYEYAHNHIWISDKYNYPLQIANLAITSKESMDFKNIVFQSDAFDIYTGNTVKIVNPSTGEDENLTIPEFDYIISNLPFISSNNQLKDNHIKLGIAKKYGLDKRVDLYQLLILKYKELLNSNSNSKIGVITSNSWFKTQKNYNSFYKIITKIFDVEFVITSNKGKWFDNADIVASILILKNKSKDKNKKVRFIGLNKNPTTCSDQELESIIQETICNIASKNINISEYTDEEVIKYVNYGLSLEALFDDIGWFCEIEDKIICMDKIFFSSRGVRTGADKLFIMDSINVDSEYSYPILKNLKKVNNYYIDEVDNYYFYTQNSMRELEEKDNTKTLEYLKTLKNMPEATGRKEKFKENWYKADQVPQYADFTTSINPDKRFFWSKFIKPTVVNQRVIAFRIKEKYKSDSDLIHALLNSSLSLFLLMSSGFGRGLGVTDLTKDGISQSYILDPTLLRDSSKIKIIKAWEKVKNKKVEDIFVQLEDEDWKQFNKIILSEYGINEYLYDRINISIKKLLERRFSVKNSE